jgi:2-succinyl-5-enolpyruvyl-6-hydroxy-3-cyclohexene-1-carboxylate synthase
VSSTEVARELIARLVAAGMRHIVIAPGSRSAPLTYAAADAEPPGCCRRTSASTSAAPGSTPWAC